VVDPVVVAAHIVTAAQTIISRNVAPLDSAVLSQCRSGRHPALFGHPARGQARRDRRTFSADEQNLIEQRLTELAGHAWALGAEAKVLTAH
jgi:hippurate hydrolase